MVLGTEKRKHGRAEAQHSDDQRVLSAYLVFRRFFGTIDHYVFYRTFLRFQPQPELLLQRGENRRTTGRRRRLVMPSPKPCARASAPASGVHSRTKSYFPVRPVLSTTGRPVTLERVAPASPWEPRSLPDGLCSCSSPAARPRLFCFFELRSILRHHQGVNRLFFCFLMYDQLKPIRQ